VVFATFIFSYLSSQKRVELRFRPLLFLPGITLFLVTTYLLVIPGTQLPKSNIISADKMVHVGLFFALTLLFTWPFKYSYYSVAQKKSWFFSIMLYRNCLWDNYGVCTKVLYD
jgi:hypothetical protein